MSANFVPVSISDSESYSEALCTIRSESFDAFSATDLSTKSTKMPETESFQLAPVADSVKLIKNKNLKSGNKKSFVWKYFAHPKNADGIEDRSRTECLECRSQLAFNASGTTTTMLNHLKSRHPKIAESEEWRKMKSGSTNVGCSESTFSITKNNESPTETLSPSTSFDPQKPANLSPDCKNSDLHLLSVFPKTNNLDNHYLEQGRLLCLTKGIPQHLMVTSCLPTTHVDSNTLSSTNSNHISLIQGENYNNRNNNGYINANNYFSANRSSVKRKRKKPISIQYTTQPGLNGTKMQSYQIKAHKIENLDKCENHDLASIQSMSAISHNSASINNILCNNFLNNDSCSVMYNDNNNNNNADSPTFLSMKPFTIFTESPSSPVSSKMELSESDRIIVYWLIKDLRPYSVLEETGMKTLFASLMPTVTIPSISIVKNEILPSIYRTLKTEILNDFSECGAGFSIELWDIPTNGTMYASVKLHYYSNVNFQLRSKMFITKEINAKNLCSDLLISCCNEIGIEFAKLRFLPVVMNNPESMRDELANVGEIEQNKKFIIIPCLMSSMQEVAKVGFQEPEVIKLLDKCRALKELVRAYNLQLDNNCVIGGGNTFLSSKYSSEKFELIYWVYLNLDQIMDKLDCFNSNRFNKDDEVFLKQLTPLLEHIYQTLNVIEQNKLFFSASMIKSIILTMNKSPFQPKDHDHQGVIQFKIAVKNRLSKIYPASGPLHEILWIATVLDPRFKKYQDSDESAMLQEIRNQIINTNELSTSSDFLRESASSLKREDLHSIFGDDCMSHEPKSEVDQYLNEHKIDIEKNPIKWWQENSSRFPNLSKVALKYLCIPLANQYGLESSETDALLYSRRRDLDPDEIDHYLFLNHNWR